MPCSVRDRATETHQIDGGIDVLALDHLVRGIWIAIAFWPARVAARKGHSFFLYFLFSLVFFPLALLVAYLVEDRSYAVA